MNTEVEIIRRCKEGDRTAFRSLVEDHMSFARAICFQLLKDADDVDDAVQESFIRVWKHLGSFDVHMKFSTWFYRIAVNVCRDALRRQKRSWTLFPLSVSDDNMLDIPAGTDLMKELIENELTERIREAVQRLPFKQRTVFILRDVQELSIDETAAILGISESAVKTNLCYARRAVRTILGNEERP